MAGGFPAPAGPLQPALPAPLLSLPAPPSTGNHHQEVEIEMPGPLSKAGSKAVVQSATTAKLDAVAPLADVSKEDQPGVKSTDIEVVQEIDKGGEVSVLQATLDAGPSASALKDAAASKQPAVEVNALLQQALCERDASKKQSGTGTCMRRPATSVKKAAPALKKPAACQAKPVAKPAAFKAKAVATKMPMHSKGPIPQGRQRLKLRPDGCSKCRQRPGCCDSCWVGRGYRKG